MSAQRIHTLSVPSAVIAMLLLQASCQMSSTITLRPDGSAFVHAVSIPVDRRSYYHHAVILDADTVVPMGVSFVIPDIDSKIHIVVAIVIVVTFVPGLVSWLRNRRQPAA